MTASFADAQTLQTERLVLAPLRAIDADEMCVVLAEMSLHEFTGGRPHTLDELRARYKRLARGHSDDGAQRWLNWIVRLGDDESAAGTVQATVSGVGEERVASVAWVIGVPWQKRGFASEATRAIVAWLTAQGITRITANIHTKHEASEKVATRAGFAATDELVDGERVWRLRAALTTR